MGMRYGTPIIRLNLTDAENQAMRRTVAGFEYLWRIEGVRYAGVSLNQFGLENYYTTDPRLELFAVSVKHWTPTGARLWTGQHVDLREGRKQYASRTVIEALEQFKRRRVNQIRILSKQLERAQFELRLCEPDTLNLTPL